MKKSVLFAAGMLAALSVAVSGCTGQKAPETAAPSSAAAQTAAETTAAGTKETAATTAATSAAAPETTAPAPQAAASEAAKETPAAAAQSVDYEEFYAPVLDEYWGAIRNGYNFEAHYQYMSNGLMEAAIYGKPDETLRSVGYQIRDISGDGIPELLIGWNTDAGRPPEDAALIAGFSCRDGEIVSIFESWARSSFRWLGGGSFHYSGSSGAMDTAYGICHLSEDGTELIWDDFFFTREDEAGGKLAIYHNRTGDWDPEKSEKLDITEEAFAERMWDVRFENYKWDTFFNYEPSAGAASGYGADPAQDPVFNYAVTGFFIDGERIEMSEVSELCSTVDQITDCRRAGDWIVVDCHVDPMFFAYEFYNIRSGSFEYEIKGANLTWTGDDLTTAVYSLYNDVYDFWGNFVGHIQNGEISALSRKDDETVSVDCWKIEGEKEVDFTEEFESRVHDRPVLAYYEYLLGGEDAWQNFAKEAPENAVALVMTNPPQELLAKLPDPVSYDKGAYDRAVLVSLTDGLTAHIDAGVAAGAASGHDFSLPNELNKGEAAVIEVTLPEGFPNGCLTAEAPGRDPAVWDVTQLSGEYPLMSKFLLEGDISYLQALQ